MPQTSRTMETPLLLAQPRMDRILSWFFGLTVVAAAGFSALTSYARHETARGEVAAEAGFSAVAAEAAGIISAVNAAPGAMVRRGDVLAELTLPPVVSEGSDTAALSVSRVTDALANIDAQASALDLSEREAAAQLDQVKATATASAALARARMALATQRLGLADQRLQRLEQLLAKGYVTQTTVDEARSTAMLLNQEAADSSLTLNEIDRARTDRDITIRARLADIRQARLALATQKLQTETQRETFSAKRTVQIVAPANGRIDAVSVRPGQRVEAGERIMAVAAPGAPLLIVLDVPSNAIGLIEAGQRVVLKYDAFPFETFGVRYGRVTRVDRASLGVGQSPPGSEAEPDKAPDRRFRVEVLPEDSSIMAYGRPRPLRIGMTLVADIEAERRTLLEWFLSPLTALRGRLS